MKGLKAGYHTTAIATNYQLRSTKDDFPHRDEETKERVQKYKAYKSHHSAKSALGSLASNEKSSVGSDKKVADSFAAAVGTADSAKDSMQQLSDAFRILETHRATMVTTFNVIEEEWRSVDKQEFAEAAKEKEKIDRLLTEVLYYEEKKMDAEKSKSEREYHDHCRLFCVATSKAVEVFEVKYQEWNSRIFDALRQYHMACAEVCEGSSHHHHHHSHSSSTPSYSAPVSAPAPTPVAAPAPVPAPIPAPIPAPAPVPAVPSWPRARGMYPFDASSPQELSFQPGDILSILNQAGNWWQAELNGRTGLIPSNYVQLI